MSLREEQCNKVCRILDNVLANRPTERDSLIVAVRKAFKALAEPSQVAADIARIVENGQDMRVIEERPHWIPVTERLPEGIGQAIVQTNGGAIHEAFYKGKNDYGHEVWMRLDGDIYWDNEVVAWMPLPEPYKGVTT